MLLKCHKTVEIKVFLNFVIIVDRRIRIRKAQKLPAPDPEHCFNGNDLMLLDSYRYLD
jgi:hypothetical protein